MHHIQTWTITTQRAQSWIRGYSCSINLLLKPGVSSWITGWGRCQFLQILLCQDFRVVLSSWSQTRWLVFSAFWKWIRSLTKTNYIKRWGGVEWLSLVTTSGISGHWFYPQQLVRQVYYLAFTEEDVRFRELRSHDKQVARQKCEQVPEEKSPSPILPPVTMWEFLRSITFIYIMNSLTHLVHCLGIFGVWLFYYPKHGRECFQQPTGSFKVWTLQK